MDIFSLIRGHFTHALPTEEALQMIAGYTRERATGVVSVGPGRGYIERLLQLRDVEVIAGDKSLFYGDLTPKQKFLPEILTVDGAKIAGENPNRALLLSVPNGESGTTRAATGKNEFVDINMAHEAVRAHFNAGGNLLFFIGTTSKGNNQYLTGSAPFFNFVRANYRQVDGMWLPELGWKEELGLYVLEKR